MSGEEARVKSDSLPQKRSRDESRKEGGEKKVKKERASRREDNPKKDSSAKEGKESRVKKDKKVEGSKDKPRSSAKEGREGSKDKPRSSAKEGRDSKESKSKDGRSRRKEEGGRNTSKKEGGGISLVPAASAGADRSPYKGSSSLRGNFEFENTVAVVKIFCKTQNILILLQLAETLA